MMKQILKESITNEVAKLYREENINEVTDVVPVQEQFKNSIFAEFIQEDNVFSTTISPTMAAKIEFDHYMKSAPLQFDKNPLEWWKKEQQRFLKIAEIAKKRLTIPATSVPCERVFSKAGQICRE